MSRVAKFDCAFNLLFVKWELGRGVPVS